MVVALGALLGAWLLAAGHALATPRLEAAIEWQGECDDRAGLHAEIEARGAELDEVPASENVVRLAIAVRRGTSDGLLAEIELLAAGAKESRQVEARDCVALRRAVAWVLGVFAEERAAAAAERQSEPSTAAFPAPSPAPVARPEEKKQPTPRRAVPPAAGPAAPPPARAKLCVATKQRFDLGSELLVGFGFVDTAALGPAVVGRYRPCEGWLPGVTLGASRLVSIGYELDSRSIRIERTSASIGAWLPLGVPALQGGLSLEAGRIRATASPSSLGAGHTASATWLSLVAPLRLAIPLGSPSLTADLGLDGLYTPRRYALRYSSGEQLGQVAHFELRGAVGLAGHF
jgi:hypothetical protein